MIYSGLVIQERAYSGRYPSRRDPLARDEIVRPYTFKAGSLPKPLNHFKGSVVSGPKINWKKYGVKKKNAFEEILEAVKSVTGKPRETPYIPPGVTPQAPPTPPPEDEFFDAEEGDEFFDAEEGDEFFDAEEIDIDDDPSSDASSEQARNFYDSVVGLNWWDMDMYDSFSNLFDRLTHGSNSTVIVEPNPIPSPTSSRDARVNGPQMTEIGGPIIYGVESPTSPLYSAERTPTQDYLPPPFIPELPVYPPVGPQSSPTVVQSDNPDVEGTIIRLYERSRENYDRINALHDNLANRVAAGNAERSRSFNMLSRSMEEFRRRFPEQAGTVFYVFMFFNVGTT